MMKKILTLALALMIAFSLAACGGKSGNRLLDDLQNAVGEKIPFGSSKSDPGASQNSESNGNESRNDGQIQTTGKTWDDLSEYTAKLPKPDFVTDSPLMLESVGDKFLRFQAVDGTTIDDIKAYISEMENAGYVVQSGSDAAETYIGDVRDTNGNIVLNYSYNFGQVSIDVPISYGYGPDEGNLPDEADASAENPNMDNGEQSEIDHADEITAIPWPDNDITKLVPKAEKATVISSLDVGHSYYITMAMSFDDAYAYAEQLVADGFEGDLETLKSNSKMFWGTNPDGVKVSLMWNSETEVILDINLQ